MWRRLLQLHHFPQGKGPKEASFRWWKKWGGGRESGVGKRLGLGAWIWVLSQLSLEFPSHSFYCYKTRGAGLQALPALMFCEAINASLELQFNVSPRLLLWGPCKCGPLERCLCIFHTSPREGIVLYVTQGPISQLINSSGNLEPGESLSLGLNPYIFFWLDDICDTPSVCFSYYSICQEAQTKMQWLAIVASLRERRPLNPS